MRRVAVFCGLTLPMILAACGGDDGGSSDEMASTETGDGDGDGDPTGDGDGDPTGDGDGDPTGDGDGDPTGDGDGDPTGDGDGDPTGDGDGDPGVFTLTSPAYAEGEVIPDANSCAGANTSPELMWVDAPAETQSFGLFFLDQSTNFNHSTIWDVPVSLDGLPADVEKAAMPADVPGAVQARSYANWFGYAGPCPQSMHTYEWTIYALDVATIDELDSNSSLAQVKAALEAHALASTTLTGTFTPP